MGESTFAWFCPAVYGHVYEESKYLLKKFFVLIIVLISIYDNI